MISTPLKNISQNGNLPQIGVKIKNIWNHHLEVVFQPWIFRGYTSFRGGNNIGFCFITWALQTLKEKKKGLKSNLIWRFTVFITPREPKYPIHLKGKSASKTCKNGNLFIGKRGELMFLLFRPAIYGGNLYFRCIRLNNIIRCYSVTSYPPRSSSVAG